ncbi:MAG TPA: TolC family protein, partial [Polyangiaceae bacterium]|nr:TolC family protein [Polyangiaceae bacterium]
MPSSHSWKLALALAALVVVEGPAAAAEAPTPEAPTPATPAKATPAAPTVDDPMLVPVPQPARRLHRWEDALVYIKARSTDLRIAEVEIARAEAQWRQALAGSLPTINLNASLTHQLITNTSLQPSSKCTPDGSVSLCPIETPFPNAANAGITAVQPLLATRAWYALGTAKQSEAVARLNVADVKRQIALRVANGMVSVVTAERLAELNRVGLRNALERLALTQ